MICSDYSYCSIFGVGRSFGGRRIYEGIDIFVGYGVLVRLICYGIIEMKGWNCFGGWCIGICDFYNNYYYYVYLGGFLKEI